MQQKKILRKRYYNLRKKKYHEISKEFFLPLVNYIKSNYKKKINLALYYPANYEINVIKFLDYKLINDNNILLPVVEKNNKMNFFLWKKNRALLVNKFGMLEPVKEKTKIPNIMIVPILSYDGAKYRLGYGKGFYDRYLNKYLKKFRKILTVGVAFSFQKHHKLPCDKNDVKLNYILTEKGMY